MVTLALIADYLSIPDDACHRVKPVGRTLSGIRLLPSDAEKLTPEHLYLIPWDRLCARGERPSLCKQYEYLVSADEDPRLEGISYAFVPTSQLAPEEVHASAQAVFELFETRFRTALLTCAMHERSIEALLNVAYPFFGNPLYVADSAFALLAHSTNAVVKKPTPQWTSIVTENILSPSIANKLDAAQIRHLDTLRDATFIETVDAKGIHDIVAHIDRNGARIANLAIIGCEAPFKPYHLALADFLVECIGYVLEGQRNFQKQGGMLYERWLLMLLEGHVRSDAEIETHLANLGWSADDSFRVAVIDFLDKPKMGPGTLTYHWRMLSLMMVDQKCFIHDGALVLVLRRPKEQQAPAPFDNSVARFLKESGLRCGVSEPFTSVLEMQPHYEQAKRIRRFAEAGAPIICHENMLADDLLAAVPFLADWRANIAPGVLRLHDADRAGGTALTESLYAYLSANRSLKEAACALNIHRNTLVYRLKRIAELCDIECAGADARLSLLLSCKIALDVQKGRSKLHIANEHEH